MDSITCEIIQNRAYNETFYYMELNSDYLAREAKPGQFVMLRPQAGWDPFLSRPFGFAAIKPRQNAFGLIYKVQGRGTKMMTQLLPGTKLQILAPLGNGFDLTAAGKRALLVAGGVGVAPLLPLAQALIAQGCQVKVLLGFTRGCDLVGQDAFVAMGAAVDVVTMDGSLGYQGMVPDYMKQELAAQPYDCVYACGPKIMLQKTAEYAIAAEVPCQVSLEERMGCGSGICMGCVCKIRQQDGTVKMRRVCHDGPVFWAQEVVWDD